MNPELDIDDHVTITMKTGEVHQSLILGSSDQEIYINLSGFGHISIRWSDIATVEKTIPAECRNGAYGPTYKVLSWQNPDL